MMHPGGCDEPRSFRGIVEPSSMTIAHSGASRSSDVLREQVVDQRLVAQPSPLGLPPHGIEHLGIARGNAYVTGVTFSTNFPTTAGAFQTTGGGREDAFVAKIIDIVLPPPTTVGKVTGRGSIDVPNGIGTFGFIVQRQAADASIHGDLRYVNHANGDKVHSVTFDSFVITGNMVTFGGTCTKNGMPCTFTVNVTENDSAGGQDSFNITIDAGPTEGAGDFLRSGAIEIRWVATSQRSRNLRSRAGSPELSE